MKKIGDTVLVIVCLELIAANGEGRASFFKVKLASRIKGIYFKHYFLISALNHGDMYKYILWTFLASDSKLPYPFLTITSLHKLNTLNPLLLKMHLEVKMLGHRVCSTF